MNDVALVPLLLTDRSALETFYRQYVDLVSKHLARRCHSPQVVADVTSRTFLKAMDKCGTWRGDRSNGSARGWLMRIASNELTDYFREQERGLRVVDKWQREIELTRADVDRLDIMIQRENAQSLRRHLDTLSDIERAVVLFIDVDGYSHAEAAEALGITRVALRARLSRAHRRLRQSLQGSTNG